MTSVFTNPNDGFKTVKSTFSSQEWCGQVFEKLSVGAQQTTLTIDSYFEGESTTQIFPGAIDIEDALWIQARGYVQRVPGTPDESAHSGSATLRRLKNT